MTLISFEWSNYSKLDARENKNSEPDKIEDIWSLWKHKIIEDIEVLKIIKVEDIEVL